MQVFKLKRRGNYLFVIQHKVKNIELILKSFFIPFEITHRVVKKR